MEELGVEIVVEIVVENMLCTVEYDYPKFHLSMLCYMCRISNGEIDLREHKSAQWLTKETLDDVDWLVCHQANQRILDASVRRLGVPAEKFYKNLDRYANTSAASIPLAIAEMKENGKLVSGHRVILCGLGGGLTWAGVMMKV